MRSYSSCLISRLRSYRKLSLLIVMSLTLLLAYLGLIFLSPEFWGISSLPCLASPVLRWAVQKTPMVLAALCCSIPGITFSLARTNCFLLSPGKPKAKPPMRSKDRKSTRLNSSHVKISYADFYLQKKHHETY